jgi:predicted metalloprotease with PDZ domain
MPQQTPFIGANVSEQNGQHIVNSVLVNSSAFVAGLSKGDVILSINGIKPSGDLVVFLQQFAIGSNLKVLVLRGGITLDFALTMSANPYPKHSLEKNKELGPRQEKLYNQWLIH